MIAFAAFAPVLIQLSHRVATVEAIVAELAQKSGQELKVKREMADEVLYVGLHPHEPKELMSLIAKAASAEWIEDGGLYLGRSNSLRLKQEREDRTAVAAGLAASLRPLIGTAEEPWGEGRGRAAKLEAAARNGPPSFDPASFRLRHAHLAAMTPAGRLLFRTLRALPAEELAAISRGTVARFALRPNRRQRPLPAEAGTTQYANERAAFATELESLSPERRAAWPEWFGSYGNAAATGALVPLLLARRDGSGAVELTMRVYDPQGREVDHAQIAIAPESGAMAKNLPGYASWGASPLKVGSSAAPFVAALRGEGVDSRQAVLLRDPTKNEPLALLLSEPLGALQAAIGAQEAVVALPDETARDAGESLEIEPKLGEFANGLAQDVDSEVREGVWLGHARYPSETVRTKASRSALQTFLRSVGERPPSLEQVGRYALAQRPDAGLSGFESLVFTAAGVPTDPEVKSGMFDVEGGGRDLLRSYAGLSPAQRTTLEWGGAVLAGTLSPSAKADLESLIFRRSSELQIPKGWDAAPDATFLADGLAADVPLRFDRVASELTTAYRLGGALRTMDAGNLGYVLESQENENRLNERGGYPAVATAHFVPGVRRRFSLVVSVTPLAEYRGVLKDVRIDPTARAVLWSELPPEHLKALKKNYDAYRAQRRGGSGPR